MNNEITGMERMITVSESFGVTDFRLAYSH